MSLIDLYEQQYAILVAEITALIGRLSVYGAGERKELCSKIESNLSDAHELLEQIGLEIHDAEPSIRPSLTNKHMCFQAELKRLQSEFKKTVNQTNHPFESDDDIDDIGINDQSKEKLLNNSERIERTGNTLAEGYRIVLETEQIGAQVLQDLHHQRETIQNSRFKIRETNADLGISSRILNSIFIKFIRDKAILFIIGIFFVIIVILSIYFSLSNN